MRERGQRNIHPSSSTDYEQDWQPHPIDPYSCYICDHTYISIIVIKRLQKYAIRIIP